MSEFFSHAWIYLPVIIGTFAVAGWKLGMRKVGLEKERLTEHNPSARVISGLELLVVIYIPAALVFGVIYIVVWGWTMPEVLDGFWRAAFLTTGISLPIQYFNIRAASLAKGEVSLTAPIQSMTPGLITIVGVVLHEFPGVMGLIGILILMIGSFIFSWERAPEHWWEYFGPFRRLRYLLHYRDLSPNEQSKTMAVVWAFGSAACGTFGLLFDSLMTRRGMDLQGLTLGWGVCSAGIAVCYGVWYLIRPDNKQGRNLVAAFRQGLQPRFVWPFLFLVCVWVVHIYAINPVFQHAGVAHIAALKRLFVPISVVLGYWIFHEESFEGPLWRVVLQRRFWVGIFIMIGVMFIIIDDLPSRIATKVELLGI